MSEITVLITSFNEQNNIEACIKSAYALSDDVVLIDTGSTDNTVKIAGALRCAIKYFPFHRYVEPSREFAIHAAGGNWAFILDADERITADLAKEVKSAIHKSNPTPYYVPQKNMFAGTRWLRHGGWYPDPVMRLIKKDAFTSWPPAIHSTPVVEGNAGYLTNHLEHYFHPSLENMVNKTAIFEDVEADLLYRAKKNVGVAIFFRKYFGELYRRLIRGAGFFDGTAGVIESCYQAYSKTITYLMLYEKY